MSMTTWYWKWIKIQQNTLSNISSFLIIFVEVCFRKSYSTWWENSEIPELKTVCNKYTTDKFLKPFLDSSGVDHLVDYPNYCRRVADFQACAAIRKYWIDLPLRLLYDFRYKLMMRLTCFSAFQSYCSGGIKSSADNFCERFPPIAKWFDCFSALDRFSTYTFVRVCAS